MSCNHDSLQLIHHLVGVFHFNLFEDVDQKFTFRPYFIGIYNTGLQLIHFDVVLQTAFYSNKKYNRESPTGNPLNLASVLLTKANFFVYPGLLTEKLNAFLSSYNICIDYCLHTCLLPCGLLILGFLLVKLLHFLVHCHQHETNQIALDYKQCVLCQSMLEHKHKTNWKSVSKTLHHNYTSGQKLHVID